MFKAILAKRGKPRFPLKMNEHGQYIKTFVIDNLTYEKAEELSKSYLRRKMLEVGFIYESHQIHNSYDFTGKFKIKAIGTSVKEDYYAKI